MAKITGRILDNKGAAIANAKILLEGITNATTVNYNPGDGQYSLEFNSPANDTVGTIIVESPGYTTEEKEVSIFNSYEYDNNYEVNFILYQFEKPKVTEIGSTEEQAAHITLVPSHKPHKKTIETNSDEQLWQVIRERTINFTHYKLLMDEIMRCQPGRYRYDKHTANDLANPGSNLKPGWKLSKNARGENIINSDGTFKIEKDFYDYANGGKQEKLYDQTRLPFTSVEAYSLLKYATEKFIKAMSASGDQAYYPADNTLLKGSPYLNLIDEKIKDFTNGLIEIDCDNGLFKKITEPILVELIWSYWHEEGFLVQSMNAISRRFQNIRLGLGNGLSKLDIDPLRPLNNILWGYIQDTQHRLTIQRRVYEYDHHYGIRLFGNAIPDFDPVDSRSGFTTAFHNLLNRCAHFYKEFDDTTRRADGFPVLNALKEVHLLLAEGAHNQFGDLPTTARIEMLMEQWILSQPEVREFLGGRIMTPYDEPWMDRIDTMKTIQNWDRTSVKYHHDLGKYGEQILLSIRYTNWNSYDQSSFAALWADHWRNEIQAYIHRYQVVTGVDLSADAPEISKAEYHIMPSLLIQKKFMRERSLKRG